MARNANTNKTGEIRDFLFNHMQKAAQGDMASHEIRGVIGMANQIHLSIQTEIKRTEQALRMGQRAEAFGQMPIS